MNRFAYRTTGLAIKTLSGLIKPRVRIYDQENIPSDNPIIFVINHFTRAETLLLPYYINKITGRTIWSLADKGLFRGGLGMFLERVGAVSTGDPDRDKLIVKTLLTNEASWIVFPEGRMVKNKKIFDVVDEKGQYIISSSVGKHPPHTGAATLALRTEFYRNRIEKMLEVYPDEAERLLDLYQIDSVETIKDIKTLIVPVNITYYPIRAKENIVSSLAGRLFENLSSRAVEELQTEGTLLLSDTDIDIRFGEPIDVSSFLKARIIQENIALPAKFGFNDSIAAKKMLRAIAVEIMERYMSSIYNMTTVNHDHIFASILKHFPGDRIRETDLKQRAYLAITAVDSLTTRTFKHDSLKQDQCHLLTDDRHHKYRNFITIAEETGAVKREDGWIVKTVDMDVLPEDFHNIRITNPIMVIANEVEPLTDLQESINDLADASYEDIRRLLSTHLIATADFEFEKDYANFAIQGESKKKNVGRPFYLKSDALDLGIFLVHGYMAAPLEIRTLAAYLNNLNITVYAPRLKGHGTSPEDLAQCHYMEWVESVEKGYTVVKNRCDRVIAGGFSMGAGLAIDLAARVDDLCGLFAIAPPLKLQNFSSNFVPAVNLWNRLLKRIHIDRNRMEYVENTPENPHINYSRNPIAAVAEMGQLMDALEPRLSSVTVPTLIVQSQADPVVDPKGSRTIFKKLGSVDKEYLLINYPHHGIVNGEGSDRVFRAVGDFVQKIKNSNS